MGRLATMVESQPMLCHGVFWNLLELSFIVFVIRITCCCRFACLECMTVFPRLFLDKSSCIQIFTKAHGIHLFKPLYLCLLIELNIYAGYIDGL
jgi:hypothetical protein